jgi:hypothetical protein
MKQGRCAGLLALVFVFLIAPPTASSRGNDVRTTLAYLRAEEHAVDEAIVALSAARASARGLVNEVSVQCPHVLAHTLSNRHSPEVLEEVSSALAIAFARPLTRSRLSFVVAVEHLAWTNPRLTRLVHLQAAQNRAQAALLSPPLCRDLLAWAASGYKALPPSTVRFLLSVKVFTEERTLHGRPIEAEVRRLLAPYENAQARRRTLRLQRAQARLLRLALDATRGLELKLARVLGPLRGLRGPVAS